MTVSKLLGHSDLKTTAVYAKTQMPVLQSAVKRLEEGISSLRVKGVLPPGNGDATKKESPPGKDSVGEANVGHEGP